MSRFKNQPVKIPGLNVEVEGHRVEKALRILAKKVNDEGRLKKVKEKEFYEKPTVARKRKKAAAIKRWERELERQKPTPNYYR